MNRRLAIVLGCLLADLLRATAPASAGGLTIPGAGAVSTSRAGAAVASTDDGEALAINPAGLAKTKGTTITVSAAIIGYSMEFDRRGTYDALADDDFAYEGTEYGVVKDKAKPPLGIGKFQPVPVIAVVSDLGGAVKGLHVAAGLYAPNAYPFRDMTNGYVFNGDFTVAPPPTRYDVLEQTGAIILPSVAAAYRISPQLDVGARFSLGFADIDTTTTVWGTPGNVTENVASDSLFRLQAKDSLIPAFGLGVTYRPTPTLELGAAFSSQVTIHAQGTATSEKGPAVNVNNEEVAIVKTLTPRCRTDVIGTDTDPPPPDDIKSQSGCVDFAVPMSVLLGGRYILLGKDGKVKGDVELNAGWENWSTELASTYRVVVDADALILGTGARLTLKDNAVRHEFKDVFTFRLGGSYHIPTGDNTVILRGGVSHDTRAAKEGFLRADVDGTARTMVSLGGAYRAKRFQVDAGFGFIYAGTQDNPGTCNVTSVDLDKLGCNNDGNEREVADRTGIDPISPLSRPTEQIESPVNQGTIKSSYLLFMLGASTWF